MWLKKMNLFFWTLLEEFQPFFTMTLRIEPVFFVIRLSELNTFFNRTQRYCSLNMTQKIDFFEYESSKWTFFRTTSRTQNDSSNWTFFITQRTELFRYDLKKLNFFVECDSKNWTSFFLQFDSNKWTYFEI